MDERKEKKGTEEGKKCPSKESSFALLHRMKRFFHCLEFLDAQRVVDFLAEDDSRVVDGLDVAVVEPLAGTGEVALVIGSLDQSDVAVHRLHDPPKAHFLNEHSAE